METRVPHPDKVPDRPGSEYGFIHGIYVGRANNTMQPPDRHRPAPGCIMRQTLGQINFRYAEGCANADRPDRKTIYRVMKVPDPSQKHSAKRWAMLDESVTVGVDDNNEPVPIPPYINRGWADYFRNNLDKLGPDDFNALERNMGLPGTRYILRVEIVNFWPSDKRKNPENPMFWGSANFWYEKMSSVNLEPTRVTEGLAALATATPPRPSLSFGSPGKEKPPTSELHRDDKKVIVDLTTNATPDTGKRRRRKLPWNLEPKQDVPKKSSDSPHAGQKRGRDAEADSEDDETPPAKQLRLSKTTLDRLETYEVDKFWLRYPKIPTYAEVKTMRDRRDRAKRHREKLELESQATKQIITDLESVIARYDDLMNKPFE